MAAPLLLPENSLSVIRGSSKTLALKVTNPDGSDYNLTGCKLVLTVKPTTYEDLPLVQKVSTVPAQSVITSPRTGDAEFYLVPADTQGLSPKKYIFDVWLVTATGERFVVIPPSTFDVQAGVTYLPL